LFFYTTTGWMMWNFLVSSLLLGVKPLLYDGNPACPGPGVLWEMAQNARVTMFGASPAYVDGLSRAGVVPGDSWDLSALDTVMLAGSPVSAECAAWFYRNVKRDLWLHVGSGGTDVCTGFTRGGCFVLGRSDATLNRYGVRIGTAEVYAALESVEEVADALIVNIDLPGGGFFMPLFITLTEGAVLDDALRRNIADRLRTQYTARHVPDKIIAVPAIPATLTGKKMEVPVRRILLGARPDDAANRNAMADPQALDAFARYASTQEDYRLGAAGSFSPGGPILRTGGLPAPPYPPGPPDPPRGRTTPPSPPRRTPRGLSRGRPA
jgi:acyl-coenzyme A synthetase/AMP-(fatty) acid ligase